ncbi:MAG TPA: ArsR family transcriptional regulator [Ktedonobacteraceae bacterium]|nr:ArsR family transcriptional regulator [Ktedonobacteraceae bacterium]
MAQQPWNQRFFASTRGQIILLLRRESRTVEELAQALRLTDNAVRAHLATLERDGLVRQRGVRRGSSKPSYVYDLSPDAESLFPKAYGVVMRQLLEVLCEHLSTEQVEAFLRTTGQRLATHWNVPQGDIQARLQAAIDVLNELGGLAELEERDGTYSIRGYSCPLAAIVPGHPEVCHLAETLLTELVGVPIHEHCIGGETPQCCFVIAQS